MPCPCPEIPVFEGDYFLVSDLSSDGPDRSRGIGVGVGGHGLSGSPELDANRFTASAVLRAASPDGAYVAFEGVLIDGSPADEGRIRAGMYMQIVKALSKPGMQELAYDALHEVWLERVAALTSQDATQDVALPREEVLV